MALFVNPQFFAQDERVLDPLLRPGDTFVDVGANIGSLSLFAASRVGHSGRIVAIEGHPRTTKYLSKNVAMNSWRNIEVLNCAAGDRAATVHFSSRRTDDQNKVSDIGIEVPMRPLDEIVSVDNVRVLKIDVEGFEYEVLRGACRTLEKTDYVYFEYRYEQSRNSVDLLRRAGFSLDAPPRGRYDFENVLAKKER